MVLNTKTFCLFFRESAHFTRRGIGMEKENPYL
jgi:hypothetical protein